MSKSISKKILLFLLVAVASLCIALPSLSLKTVKADRVPFEATGETVTGSTDVQGRIDEITEGIEFYRGAIPEELLQIDPNGDVLTELTIAVEVDFGYGEYDSVAESLYGECGLNGLLGIYEVAYEFYANYVFADPTGTNLTAIGETNGFAPSVDKVLIEKATDYLDNFKAVNFVADNYKKSSADALVTAFVESETFGLEYAKKLQADLVELSENRKKQVDYICGYYFSDKFGSAYTNKTVYESDEDVSVAEATKVKTAIDTAISQESDYAVVKELMAKAVKDYEDLFQGLQTALSRTYAEIHAKADLSAEDAGTTSDLLALAEEAFKKFEALGTIKGYVEGYDGQFTEVDIDLKTGNPVDQGNDNLGDLNVALNLMTEYRALVKRGIVESKTIFDESYGVSADKVINDYLNYAKGLADCLTGYYGKLTAEGEEAPTTSVGYKANQYSYVNQDGETVKVVYGSDIVKAFNDSLFCDGALVIEVNGEHKESIALTEFKKKSAVVDDSNENYTVTITCIDENGDEVAYFNADAVLTAREGATPSVERNLYLILKGDMLAEGTVGLDDETRNYLNGRVLQYYFTFTISSSTIKDGKLTVLEFEEPITVQISIKFKKAELYDAVKEKTCALSYEHANVNTVYSDIVWGDSTMTFKVTNFANQAQMAMATEGEAPLDLVKYIALGLLGLVALLFLIWLVVAIIKNWKYRIIFNARGGKYNSCIKVKLHEKFNHPAPPVRKGYKFLGWYADSACTVRFALSELEKRGKVKVYAKWISNEEFEKLNEKYGSAAASVGVGAVVIDPTNVTVKKDPQIEKIEAEKLSYEAKKAEEERKTEEVKLQAIREIDEAKKNDEARAKAEQEASDAKAELEKSLAERDELIKSERADERAKCIEEMRSAGAVSDVDYEAAIAKAKAETEEKLRKEFDEESKARAEEQARINAELSDKIKALEEANAKSEEEARRLAEEAEARRKADEEKLNAALAAAAAAKLAETVVEEPANEPEEEAEVEEPAPEFDTDHVFDVLKAEIYSYTDADDLGYGLEANVPACAMKVVDKTIELEVNLDAEDCAKKGYKVTAGAVLPVKFVLASDDDIDEAEELIEETMLVNGLKRTKKAVITAATDETREKGFEYGVSKDKVADTPEEFYKLMRVFAKSFVLADDDAVEDKTLMKMFLTRGRVYLYLNHSAEGLKACDEEMANAGFKSFMTVKTIEDCKEAIALISAMMKANGLVRFPSEIKIAEEDCSKGFTYTLSK